MNVGKHKKRFFDEVLDGAPEYCDWAMSLEDPSDSLVLFIDYARVHKASEQAAKKPRTDEKACVICCDRPIDTAFVPCGHLVSCLPCAWKFNGDQCPMCKKRVEMVLKTYHA